ncbi:MULTISPECIES: hypothetical protein [unclassified Aureimonas]|uniref:hypothetical protein n=1 Tax=unclassified Aureimonas TaxID=2615206 RepID=UPI0006F2E82F|nr:MULTISPECIES: hypothetical protein [unclassified Aureimonas]KQT62560.1 hypothetical protein ASG62_22830 [Aureimonas sp. Leaf427]KQT73212.1 hypothetical protein ASG54_18195 [Aureimonas sp. Leaf460]
MSDQSRGWFLVIDDVTGDFTIEGPSPDLDRWKAAVEAAQAAGQKVKWVFDEGLRDEAVAQAKHQFGGKERFPAGSIVGLS